MHTVWWENKMLCYKMLDYGSKLSQIKLPPFHVFGRLHEFSPLQIYNI